MMAIPTTARITMVVVPMPPPGLAPVSKSSGATRVGFISGAATTGAVGTIIEVVGSGIGAGVGDVACATTNGVGVDGIAVDVAPTSCAST